MDTVQIKLNTIWSIASRKWNMLFYALKNSTKHPREGKLKNDYSVLKGKHFLKS